MRDYYLIERRRAGDMLPIVINDVRDNLECPRVGERVTVREPMSVAEVTFTVTDVKHVWAGVGVPRIEVSVTRS